MSIPLLNLEESFDRRLELLSEVDRSAFECCARTIEEIVCRESLHIELWVSRLVIPDGLRELVLVHAGKVWIEVSEADPADYLTVFPELRDHSWAVHELFSWKAQLSVPMGGGPKKDFEVQVLDIDLDLDCSQVEKNWMDASKFEFPDFLKPLRAFERSGMGHVWLMHNQRTNREEVLKAANHAVLSDPELLSRFRSEPGKTSQFNLDSIVTVYSCDEFQGIPYFLMEHMNSGSLADKLSSGPIVAQQAVKYLATIARTVGRVHERGLIHHDIKPGNILFTRTDDQREVVKLGDFGLARTLPAKWKEGISAAVEATILVELVPTRLVGTAGFISPEAFDIRLWNDASPSELEKGVQADVFALGATLYYALTGRLPYQQLSESGMHGVINPLAAVMHDLIPVRLINPAIDVELDAICQRALRKSPGNRFRDAYDLAGALEHWLGQAKLRSAAERRPVEGPDASAPPRVIPDPQHGVSSTVVITPESLPVDSLWPQFSSRSLRKYAPPAIGMAAATILLALAFVDPNSTQGPLTEVGNKRPAGVGDPPPAGDGNNDIPQKGDLAQTLIKKNWPADTAGAVAKLNQPWFECLKSSETVDLQKFNLCSLSNSNLPLSSLKNEPHIASLLSSVASDGTRQNILTSLTVDIASQDRPAVLNVYLRESGRRKAESLTRFLQKQRPLGLALQSKGLIGSEVLLLGSENNQAPLGLSKWLTEILQMGKAEKLDEFLPYFALFVCQGREISMRMAQNPKFERQFFDELWPNFKALTRSAREKGSGPSVAHLMSEPAVWDALADPEGVQLITEFGLVPVVLLYGEHAYPANLHPRLKELLKSRVINVIQSLLAPDLRSNPDFTVLLAKKLDVPILATALFQIRQAGSPEQIAAKLKMYVSKVDADLMDELRPLTTPPELLDTVQQGIYLTVGFKALSGQRVGRREWEKVTQRAVLDVLNMISTYYGASPTFLQGAETGYWSTVNVMDAARDQNLKNLQKQANQQGTNSERDTILRQAESELVHSQEFIKTIAMIKDRILRRPGHNVIDLTPSVRFFSLLAPDELRSQEIIDWRQVAVYELPDRRALMGFRPECTYGLKHPDIAKFFNDRVSIVKKHFDAQPGTQTPLTAINAEIAWRESVSAWWLLGGAGELPLTAWSGEYSEQLTAPADSSRN